MGIGKLWGEFKAFAFKGNMIELAVAVIIGAAFGTVVTSLTQDVIMPTIGYVINTGEKAAATVKDSATHAVSAVASKTGMTTQPTTEPSTQPVADAGTPAGTAVVAATAAVSDEKAKADAQAKADADAAAAKAKTDAEAKPDPAAPIKIDLMIGPVNVGKFIGALLNFLIVAFAVFIMVVKLMGGVMKRLEKPEAPGEPTTRECPECLSIIPIKARRCSHCTAVIVPPVTPAV